MLKPGFFRLASILLPVALLAQPLSAKPLGAQTPAARYRAFDSKGRAVTLEEIVAALDKADVLLIGETHNDATAHLLEAELLRRADERFSQGSSTRKRTVALSLEMFERDVQTVLDEYLAGLVTERHFLLSSRPWRNYETDYRPLVEYARAHSLSVIAANAPARYVSRVSANGPDSLQALSKSAKSWLPPLPFQPASDAYAAKFARFMGGGMASAPASPHTTPAPAAAQTQTGAHGSLHLLDAQNLRDASMAHAIAEYLKSRRDALVVGVNGTFHSEERLGVPDQLKHYSPKARAVVVTIVSDEGFPAFDAERLGKLGDFVIITDPTTPRSS
jgi:uncharacterized iron-regulated protein